MLIGSDQRDKYLDALEKSHVPGDERQGLKNLVAALTVSFEGFSNLWYSRMFF